MKTCDHCGDRVQWLRIRGGRRLPFNAELVEVEQLPEGVEGWLAGRVTVRGQEYTAVMPMSQCGSAKVAAARRVLIQHACPQYLATTGARSTP